MFLGNESVRTKIVEGSVTEQVKNFNYLKFHVQNFLEIWEGCENKTKNFDYVCGVITQNESIGVH